MGNRILLGLLIISAAASGKPPTTAPAMTAAEMQQRMDELNRRAADRAPKEPTVDDLQQATVRADRKLDEAESLKRQSKSLFAQASAAQQQMADAAGELAQVQLHGRAAESQWARLQQKMQADMAAAEQAGLSYVSGTAETRFSWSPGDTAYTQFDATVSNPGEQLRAIREVEDRYSGDSAELSEYISRLYTKQKQLIAEYEFNKRLADQFTRAAMRHSSVADARIKEASRIISNTKRDVANLAPDFIPDPSPQFIADEDLEVQPTTAPAGD